MKRLQIGSLSGERTTIQLRDIESSAATAADPNEKNDESAVVTSTAAYSFPSAVTQKTRPLPIPSTSRALLLVSGIWKAVSCDIFISPFEWKRIFCCKFLEKPSSLKFPFLKLFSEVLDHQEEKN